MTGFDPQAIIPVIAFFAPLIVSIVKQAGWPSSVNGIIALVVYAIGGAIAVVAQGQAITLDTVVPTITLFATVGTVAYNAFWQHTGLERAVTNSTSIVKAPLVDTFDVPEAIPQLL